MPGPDDTRNVLADQAAGYWQAPFSSLYLPGTEFKLKGQFPASRNMSIQVTNSLIGFLNTIGAITDYQIAPDPGSQNPFTAVNIVDPSIAAGGDYTVIIHYGKAPADPKPNTIYLDPKQFVWTGAMIIVYRIYAPVDGSLADHGGVPLPALYLVTDHGDVPISEFKTPAQCAFWTAAEAVVVQGEAAIGNVPLQIPLAPRPIPAQPVPRAPVFKLWGGTDVLGQLKIAQWVVNADNSYVYTYLNQRAGDLVLVRAKAPSYATEAGITDPQVRYWSLCESSIPFLSTYQCVKDQDFATDANGYFTAVISIPKKRPANADAAHGYNWLEFGPAEPASPIFRYLSPSPNFAEAPSNFDPKKYDSLAQLMGDYYPLATYCAKSVFDAHTNAGETPAQVFAACQAGE